MEHVSTVTIPLLEYENLKQHSKALGVKYSLYLDNCYHRHEAIILTKDEAIMEMADKISTLSDRVVKLTDAIANIKSK